MKIEAPEIISRSIADSNAHFAIPEEAVDASFDLHTQARVVFESKMPSIEKSSIGMPSHGSPNGTRQEVMFRRVTDYSSMDVAGKTYKMRMREEFEGRLPASESVSGISITATTPNGREIRLLFFTQNQGVRDWDNNRITDPNKLIEAREAIDFMQKNVVKSSAAAHAV